MSRHTWVTSRQSEWRQRHTWVTSRWASKLCRGHGVLPTAVLCVERFHINHVASATRALICLVTLTFDLETGAHALLPVGWAQPFYQFWCFWDISFSSLDLCANTCQTHVTSRRWPLTLEVMALVRVIWVFMLHLCTKFGLSVQKTWRTFDDLLQMLLTGLPDFCHCHSHSSTVSRGHARATVEVQCSRPASSSAVAEKPRDAPYHKFLTHKKPPIVASSCHVTNVYIVFHLLAVWMTSNSLEWCSINIQVQIHFIWSLWWISSG